MVSPRIFNQDLDRIETALIRATNVLLLSSDCGFSFISISLYYFYLLSLY